MTAVAMPQARYLWGPLTLVGAIAALATCAADQASKLWLLRVYDLASKGAVKVMPYVDFVLTWNTGISYGMGQVWFQSPVGQWALVALKAIAVLLLWVWLARAHSRLTALALGLIIGGAIGNAIDRYLYGAVADFVLLHLETPTWRFNWYVFNLADVAIVAGVAVLLYESVRGDRAPKAP